MGDEQRINYENVIIWQNLWGNYFQVDDFVNLIKTAGFHVCLRKKDTALKVSLFTRFDQNCRVACLNRALFDAYRDFLQKEKNPESINLFQAFLESIHFRLNPADLLFYADQKAFRPEMADSGITLRRLTMEDSCLFEEMTAQCTVDDLDAGNAELHHELVFGAFFNGKMVSRASARAWDDEGMIYDLGYVTHPEFRRKGFGKMCASEVTKTILALGKIPQIRVQPQIFGSIGIARSLGYQFYGTWEYDYIED